MALAAEVGDERLLGIAERQYVTTELLRGQYTRAVRWADRAAAHNADQAVEVARAATIRGTALVDTGRYGEGVRELETALSLGPSDADPHNAAYALSMLGRAHLLTGEYRAAIEPLDRAVQLAGVHWIALRPWPESLRA
jgi:tetratricopeptide (TPR) repeat protein